MITKIYGVIGAILMVILGLAWFKGSVLDQNMFNGVISFSMGTFGIIYILLNSLRKVSKKDKVNASKNA